jgi:hypothetical protein
MTTGFAYSYGDQLWNDFGEMISDLLTDNEPEELFGQEYERYEIEYPDMGKCVDIVCMLEETNEFVDANYGPINDDYFYGFTEVSGDAKMELRRFIDTWVEKYVPKIWHIKKKTKVVETFCEEDFV